MTEETWKVAFVTDTGTTVQGWEAIVPICTFHHTGEMHCIGTGFFISVCGIFVTAAHVLMDITDEEGEQLMLADGQPAFGLFVLQFIPPQTMLRRKVEIGSCHIRDDVAVGIAEPLFNKQSGERFRNKILGLTARAPRPDQEVFTWAFPNSEADFDGKQATLSIRPKLYAGVIEQEFREGKGWGKVSGRCYQTSLAIEGGASGGPVFGEDGQVFAVNSGAIAGTDVAYVSHIQSISGLQLPNLQTSDGVVHDQITIRQLIDDGAISVDEAG